MNMEIIGLDELLWYMGDLEKLPQKVVTKSAKLGAKISQADAKARAPFLSGALESGIILKAEKSRLKGKKVYQITINPSMNDVFQKPSKTGKGAYYPSSQEFGFRTKNGGYIPGIHYMRDSLTSNASQIESVIVSSVIAEIDKLK